MEANTRVFQEGEVLSVEFSGEGSVMIISAKLGFNVLH